MKKSKKNFLRSLLLIVFLVGIFISGKMFFSQTEKRLSLSSEQRGKFYAYSGSSDLSEGVALSACWEADPNDQDPSTVCSGVAYQRCSGGLYCGNCTNPYTAYGTKTDGACCHPDCSGASSYCTSQTFNDGCGGTCSGTTCCPSFTEADCGNLCGSAWNGCWTVTCSCSGLDTCVNNYCTPPPSCSPDCSNASSVCSGTLYTSLNKCGTCTGTKTPSCSAFCVFACTGVACGDDGCGTTCYGTRTLGCCTPTNSCAADTCTGSTCFNGCINVPGLKGPDCSDAGNHCSSDHPYASPNGCGTCNGTKNCNGGGCRPDCSNAYNVCSTISFPDGCPGSGICWGTKNCTCVGVCGSSGSCLDSCGANTCCRPSGPYVSQCNGICTGYGDYICASGLTCYPPLVQAWDIGNCRKSPNLTDQTCGAVNWSLSLSANPNSGYAPLTSNLTAKITAVFGGENYSYTNHSCGATNAAPTNISGGSFTCTYSSDGTYQASVTATAQSTGVQINASATIIVTDPPCSPDCSDAGNHCSSDPPYASPNNCGTCRGTKSSDHQCLPADCSGLCGKQNNTCASICGGSCSGVDCGKADCGACNNGLWKEVAP